MASPPLSTIRQVARDYSGDNDANSANWRITQAVQDEVINRFVSRLQRVMPPWYQELAAATSGLTINTGVTTVDTTLTTIRELESLYLAANAGSTVHTSEALELCDDFDLDSWAADYTPAANEAIQRYSKVRLGDSTKAAGTVGRWRVRVNPAPQATAYLVARCVLEPSTLSAATDVADLSDDAGYHVAVLAGAWMARRIGKSELYVQGLLSELPDIAKALAGQAAA